MDYAYQAYSQFIKTWELGKQTTPRTLESDLERFWDSVMLQVTQATTDEGIRTAYRILLRQARTQGQTLQWQSEPEVFYSTAGANRGKRKLPWLGLLAGLVLAGMIVWFAVPHKHSDPIMAWITAGALVLAAAQLWLLWSAVPEAPSVNVRTEARVDPAMVRAGLQRMVRELDAHAQALCAMLDAAAPQNGAPDISLAQELLRLPPDRRDPAVMAVVDRYLVRQGVEQVLYSEEKKALFMVLPGSQEMTVEPALVRDGQLLHMGVACVVMEE